MSEKKTERKATAETVRKTTAETVRKTNAETVRKATLETVKMPTAEKPNRRKSVAKSTLQKLMAYLEYHEGQDPPEIPTPMRYPEMSGNTGCKWDACYIDDVAKNVEDLRNLLLLAKSLEISSLLLLCCARLSLFIKGKPFHVVIRNLRGGSEPGAGV